MTTSPCLLPFRRPFRRSRPPALRLACGLLLLAFLPWPALAAQETANATENAQNSEGTEVAEGTNESVPPELASPRATMRTYLESLAAGDLDLAVSTLDLSESGLSERLQAVRGPELAIELKNAVDRVRLVNFEEISDHSTGSPYLFWRGREGLIEIAQADDGAWRFSVRTIERLPQTTAELADRQTVEGVVLAPKTRAQWLRSQVPASLTGPGFILEHWQWLALIALVILGVAIDLLARLILFAVVSNRVEGLVKIDPAQMRRSLRPFGLVVMAAFWWFGLGWLGLPERPLAVLGTAIEFVAVVGGIWGVYRLIELVSAFLLARAARTESKLDDMLVPLFERSAKIVVLVFGLIFLADSLRIPIASLLAGVGVGGIALALAAQDLVKNLFGSVTVLLDRPFEIGDYILVSGIEGTVEEVAFRSTRIRTPNDSVVTLPNANLISASVENLGRRRFRRWRTTVGVEYGTPTASITEFCDRLRQIIEGREDTRKEGFYAELNHLGASSLDVLFQVYFDVPGYADELRSRHEMAVAILDLAQEMGIEIAFPTQTVHLQPQHPAEPVAPSS